MGLLGVYRWKCIKFITCRFMSVYPCKIVTKDICFILISVDY